MKQDKIYTSFVDQIMEQLAKAIENDNRESFHQGIIAGAEAFFGLLNQGNSPEEALKICRRHKFIKLFDEGDEGDNEPEPEASEATEPAH